MFSSSHDRARSREPRPAVEVEEERLREWVIDSLIAAAAEGEDRLGDH
jgi:hypothetical protein